jgi:hypothetical protein
MRYICPSGFYNNNIWPLLPTTADYGTYNQVEVRGTHPMTISHSSGLEIKHRVLDDIVPWNTPSNIPNFKQPNVEQIQSNYKKGDRIIVIGGGNGVSAVHSANIVGIDGEVMIYEGDEERGRDLERTLKHNGVFDICNINHSIVGHAHHIESPGSANVVQPSDLPPCDALEMDCEGAEFEILKNIAPPLPDKIIVELHHKKAFSPYSSPDTIESILEKKGYSVCQYDGPWVNGLFVAQLK